MKKRKKNAGINASSMSDIAFLLLIFFLVTTTMDAEQGIMVQLPPDGEEVPYTLKNRNVLEILINSQDQLMVEGKLTEVDALKQITKDHLTNNGRLPHYAESAQKAIISIKNDPKTSYKQYIAVYNELKAAYNEVRNESAEKLFKQEFKQLNPDKQALIRDQFPMRISEAEL